MNILTEGLSSTPPKDSFCAQDIHEGTDRTIRTIQNRIEKAVSEGKIEVVGHFMRNDRRTRFYRVIEKKSSTKFKNPKKALLV